MTPSIDLRISTMLRAMEQVVSPAIDPGNNLAKEQLALVIGQLKLLRAQWHRADDYAAACLEDLAQVVGRLEPEGGAATGRAFEAARDSVAGDVEDSFEAAFKAAMAAADALVRAADIDASDDFRRRLHADLLAFSKRQSLRDRSWFALSGFDLKPDELLSIDAIIGGASS